MLDFLWKPVRGIGRVARGLVTMDGDKLKQGIGDVGAGVKGAAPILAMTGVGAPLAIGLGAAGGAAEKFGTGGDVGDILKGAAGGGALAGVGALGSKLLSGGQAAASAAGAGGGSGGAGAALGAGGTRMIAPAAVGPTLGQGGLLGKMGGAASGIASWAKANPQLALEGAGAAANAYGAHQAGQAIDRQTALREQEMRRGWEREENLDPILGEIINRLLADDPVRRN